MVILYMVACTFLGMQTIWWLGVAAFIVSWAVSFAWGMVLIQKWDGDSDKLHQNTAAKHVVLLGSILMAALYLA